MPATEIPSLVNALSGAIGGAFANLAVFPMDLVTTRLQVQNKIKSDTHYSSVLDAFIKTYKAGGVAEFYEGVFGDTAGTMIQAFLYFFAYDHMRNRRLRQIHANTGKLPRTLGVGEELVIGSAAGVFCKAFTSPINNVVIRQQSAALVEGKDLTALECAKEIYETKGITGFWAGYKATILLSINPSLTYYFYQSLFARVIPRARQTKATRLEVFLIAAIAKSIATLITYPVILAKTRTQVETEDSKLPFYVALYRTIRDSGVGALYDGATAQLIKGFFSQGITMMTKDQITRFIVISYLRMYGKPRPVLARA